MPLYVFTDRHDDDDVGLPGNEALVDAVVISLQVENLQSLLARCHPRTCLDNLITIMMMMMMLMMMIRNL